MRSVDSRGGGHVSPTRQQLLQLQASAQAQAQGGLGVGGGLPALQSASQAYSAPHVVSPYLSTPFAGGFGGGFGIGSPSRSLSAHAHLHPVGGGMGKKKSNPRSNGGGNGGAGSGAGRGSSGPRPRAPQAQSGGQGGQSQFVSAGPRRVAPTYMGDTANRRHKLGPSSTTHAPLAIGPGPSHAGNPNSYWAAPPSATNGGSPVFLPPATTNNAQNGGATRFQRKHVATYESPPMAAGDRSLNSSPTPTKPPTVLQVQVVPSPTHQAHGPLAPLQQQQTVQHAATTVIQVPASAANGKGSSSAPAAIVTTTTTTTSTTSTTTTPILTSVSVGGAGENGVPPVLSNTIPDLLFLLNPNEHQQLMQLLRGRIDGARGKDQLVLTTLPASNVAVPLSPTTGSLRRPSFISSIPGAVGASPVQIPAQVPSPITITAVEGPNGGGPTSPSRVLHFDQSNQQQAESGGGGPSTLMLPSVAPGATSLIPDGNAAGQQQQLGANLLALVAQAGPLSPTLGPAPGARMRSKSFSNARNSLPRRPSLMSVREEGGLLPNPQNHQQLLQQATAAQQMSQQEILRAAIAGGGSPVLKSAIAGSGADRPRATSLFVRPLGGGGLIPLPPNWSRQGSNATSASSEAPSDDDESDDELSSTNGVPNVGVLDDASDAAVRRGVPVAALLRTGTFSHSPGPNSGTAVAGAPNQVLPPAGRGPTLGRSRSAAAGDPSHPTVHAWAPSTATEAQTDRERAQSANADHDGAVTIPNNNKRAHRYTMGSSFSAALQSALLPPAPRAVGGQGHAGHAHPTSSEKSSVGFDAESEENGGQFWSLSHASLLLERVALEKEALPPLMSTYLSQALAYIATAREIVKTRITRRMEVAERLKAHPENVADWLQEFNGGEDAAKLAEREREREVLEQEELEQDKAEKELAAQGQQQQLLFGNDSATTTPTHAERGSCTNSAAGTAHNSSRRSARMTMSGIVLPKVSRKASISLPNSNSFNERLMIAADSTSPSAGPTTADVSYFALQSVLLQDPILEVLSKADHWDFDIFELDNLTGGHSLLLLGVHLIQLSGVLSHFPEIDLDKVYSFFRAVEQGYHKDIPYHNATHGADVLQGMFFFLRSPLLLETLTPLDVLAGLVAACCHDYDHPGVNNVFHVTTGHRLALLYNDTAVLESHHAAASWQLLAQPEHDFLSALGKEERVEFRGAFLSAILHTDMSMHMKSVMEFETSMKNKRAHGTWFTSAVKEDRKLLLDMACHVSDLGNPAKPFPLAREWTKRVVEEFFAQGDQEAALGLKISPMCDRAKAAVDAQQFGFIDFVVLPLFTTWADALTSEAIAPCLSHLASNKAYYKGKKDEAAAAAAAASPPPPATPAAASAVVLTHLAASSLFSAPWKNGQGSTKQMLLHPSSAVFPTSPFDYRLSSARMDAAGPFSSFPGYSRLLASVAGSGRCVLTMDGVAKPLEPLAPAVAFDGEAVVTCALDDASKPVTDVGLIYAKALTASAKSITLQAGESQSLVLTASPASHFMIVLLGGAASITTPTGAKHDLLNTVDSLLLAQPLAKDLALQIQAQKDQPTTIVLFQVQAPAANTPTMLTRAVQAAALHRALHRHHVAAVGGATASVLCLHQQRYASSQAQSQPQRVKRQPTAAAAPVQPTPTPAATSSPPPSASDAATPAATRSSSRRRRRPSRKPASDAASNETPVEASTESAAPPARTPAGFARASRKRAAAAAPAAIAAAVASAAAPSTTTAPAVSASGHHFVRLVALAGDEGMRFDRWLRSRLPPHAATMPWAALDKLCRDRVIRRSNPSTKAAQKLPLLAATRIATNDEITLPKWLLKPKQSAKGKDTHAATLASVAAAGGRCGMGEAEQFQLRATVLYEDADLLVLNKPAGLAMHPGVTNERRYLTGMLWALEEYAAKRTAAATAAASTSPSSASSIATPAVPAEPYRIVMWLDKETSGCVLVAKNARTADLLLHLLKQAASGGVAHEDRDEPITPPPYSPSVWAIPTDDTSDASGATSAASSHSPPLLQTRYMAITHLIPSPLEGHLLSPSASGSLCHSSYRVHSSVTPAFPTPLHTPYALVELLPHTVERRLKQQLRRHCHQQLACPIVGERLHELDEALGPTSPQHQQQQLRERIVHQWLSWSDPRALPLFLHAHQLILHHPDLHQGKPLIVLAQPPQPFAHLTRILFLAENQQDGLGEEDEEERRRLEDEARD